MYSWIPFFTQLANKLLAYEARQPELVAMLRDAGVDAGLMDRDKDGKEFRYRRSIRLPSSRR